ncbi:MAG TPA: peptidoglycan-binding domain-containing protein, partial [Candidatus Paceibacterota bacterium]|nr:peptidoglycan-binding domain-containing protein [Candidatus Paceibacterota bacterium]
MARKKKVVEVVEEKVPFHKQDITHYMVGALAVFGLSLSCLFATLGVAAVGINVQVALASHQTGYSQSAALALSERVDHRIMETASTSNVEHHMPPAAIGSTTKDMKASPIGFCPKISRTIGRGTMDATSTGDVAQLQMFIANHFGLNPGDVVSGFFGSTTQAFVQKFQMEQGIATATAAGPLTRAAIMKVCGGDKDNGPGQNSGPGNGSGLMGSSTMPTIRHEIMQNGSSTAPSGSVVPPRPEHPKMPPP